MQQGQVLVLCLLMLQLLLPRRPAARQRASWRARTTLAREMAVERARAHGTFPPHPTFRAQRRFLWRLRPQGASLSAVQLCLAAAAALNGPRCRACRNSRVLTVLTGARRTPHPQWRQAESAMRGRRAGGQVQSLLCAAQATWKQATCAPDRARLGSGGFPFEHGVEQRGKRSPPPPPPASLAQCRTWAHPRKRAAAVTSCVIASRGPERGRRKG
jgi:hypothetical protein